MFIIELLYKLLSMKRIGPGEGRRRGSGGKLGLPVLGGFLTEPAGDCGLDPEVYLVLEFAFFWPRERGASMARVCQICGKRPRFGHQVSHAHNVSQRVWQPNLQSI